MTDLSDELSGDTVRLDLHLSALSPLKNKIELTMTKDLSLTVLYSPAIVLGPSIIRGDLMATLSAHPLALSSFWALTLIGGPSGNSSSCNETSTDPGSRLGGNGGEGPHCKVSSDDGKRGAVGAEAYQRTWKRLGDLGSGQY
jgi:hypothetical protein